MDANIINENTNLTELSFAWLNFKKAYIKHSSYGDYSNIINYYILPAYGNMTIKTLKIQMIQHQIDAWAKKGLSLNTLKLILCVLKSIYEYYNAFSDDKFLINFRLLHLPQIPDKFIEVYTSEEQNKIVKFLFQNPKKVNLGIAFGLFAGLRIGEACAIKWSDIDLHNNTLSVVGTVQRISIDDNDEEFSKSKLSLSTPKSKQSIRTVPIMTSLKVLLLQNEPDVLNNEDTYVTSGKTTPTDPKYMRSVYKKMIKKLDIHYLKFHCLRHTFASSARSAGMPIEYLSKIIGHRSVQTTIDIYLHPRLDDLRKAMLEFENNWF